MPKKREGRQGIFIPWPHPLFHKEEWLSIYIYMYEWEAGKAGRKRTDEASDAVKVGAMTTPKAPDKEFLSLSQRQA